MTILMASDLHLNHWNIVKYCNRPFFHVEEMNQALIDNWNSVVTDKDVVWVIGDFCFEKKPLLWSKM